MTRVYQSYLEKAYSRLALRQRIKVEYTIFNVRKKQRIIWAIAALNFSLSLYVPVKCKYSDTYARV